MTTHSIHPSKLSLLLAGSLTCGLATSCVDPGDSPDAWDEPSAEDPHDSALGDVLQVSVTRDPGASDEAQHLIVEVTIENTTDAPVQILAWRTPFDELGADMFSITHAGQDIEYIGPIAKRGEPTASDYLTLAPNEVLSKTVDLSQLYATQPAGEYEVRYTAHVTTMDRGAGLVRSNAIRAVQGVELDYPEYERPRAAGLSFTSCSATQQAELRRAMGHARSHTDSALANLQFTFGTDRANSPRYTTWFGAYTSQRYDTVMANFETIDDALTDESIVIDCSCTSGIYAYVYSNQPYKIYMCNAFWNADDIGTDSRAGTIIHEVSHFSVVADTDDHAYGHSSAQSLADNDPDDAIANADSYEYFAENTSWLAMVAGTTGNNDANGHWGDWGVLGQCPLGEYAYGYRLRSQAPQGGGDNTALNDIELYCASPNTSSYTRIWSAYLSSGSFSPGVFCNGTDNPLMGFDVRIEAPQGAGDDTAANDIDFYCYDGTMISAAVQTYWGSWTDIERCPPGQAVTGLLTRVEASQGAGDDTALNGLRVVCEDY